MGVACSRRGSPRTEHRRETIDLSKVLPGSVLAKLEEVFEEPRRVDPDTYAELAEWTRTG